MTANVPPFHISQPRVVAELLEAWLKYKGLIGVNMNPLMTISSYSTRCTSAAQSGARDGWKLRIRCCVALLLVFPAALCRASDVEALCIVLTDQQDLT